MKIVTAFILHVMLKKEVLYKPTFLLQHCKQTNKSGGLNVKWLAVDSMVTVCSQPNTVWKQTQVPYIIYLNMMRLQCQGGNKPGS